MTKKEREILGKEYINNIFRNYCDAIEYSSDKLLEDRIKSQMLTALDMGELLGAITSEESEYILTALIAVKRSYKRTVWSFKTNTMVSYQLPNTADLYKEWRKRK